MMNTCNDGFGVEVFSITLATKVSYKSTEAVWQNSDCSRSNDIQGC